MTQDVWVQHKSGIGEKWRVVCRIEDRYVVSNPIGPDLQLPKTEYIPCEPPERWENVTAECEFHDTFNRGTLIHYGQESVGICELKQGYRLRKVRLYLAEPTSKQNCEQWAIVVERRNG